jgi:ferredoxin
MQYIAFAQRAEYEKCAEESFDCVMCGICSARCPAGISHPQVGLLSRRMTGKYIRPESGHLRDRVDEILRGDYDNPVDSFIAKPLEELKELYDNREIEA